MAKAVDPFYEKYGRRIQRARLRAGLTQEVASGLLGMDQTNLSRIELGKQALTIKDAAKMADLFQVSFDELVIAISPWDAE